ncbi:MAG TPA: AsmA family protein, partial [Afifellaceae bacterium]|nr:AsmA family protein [Afifellaceae bacterium]
MILNRLYIAIGLLIILVLSTALVAPYLIDWTSYRQTFEREAGAYLGRPVTVAGKASVRLLPTPILNFTNVRVGDEADPDLTVENLRAELELPALLRGDVRIVQMRVDRPTMRLDIAALSVPRSETPDVSEADRSLDPDAVSLDSLEISSGQMLLYDSRTGRQWAVESLNAQLEARSLNGPGKIEGGLVIDGSALSFRASAGRMAPNGAIPMKVNLYSAELPFVSRLSGRLMTRSEAGFVYEGSFSTAELAHLDDLEEEPQAEALDVPADGESQLLPVVEASGNFRLTADSLSLPEMQISYGLRDRPLQLAGEATLSFGAEPYFNASLDARQIDVDRALGGGPSDPVAISKAVQAFLDNFKSLPLAPIDGELHLDAKGVVVGGSVIQAVGADLKPRRDGWKIDILSALLPGQTRVDLSGGVQIAGTPRFKGRGKVNSGNPAAFASWWRGEAGAVAIVDGFTIEADLDIAEGEQVASGIAADLDGGTLNGSMTVRQFQESGGQVFVDIDLEASRLDLDKARAVAGLFAGDAISGGHVDRMAVNLTADRLFAGGVDARNVEVSGTLHPEAFELKTLFIADLAGATISARGRINDPMGAPSGRVNLNIAAEDLAGTAQFLKSLIPANAAVSQFETVAGALSPAEAEMLLSANQQDGKLAFDVDGTFGGTRVNLGISGRGGLDDLIKLDGQIDALVVAEQTETLLRQAGLDVLPLDNSGPARIAFKAVGQTENGFTVTSDGTLAGIGFSFAGDGRLVGGRPVLTGKFDGNTRAVDNALLLAGIALPGIGEGYPVTANGEATIDGTRIELALTESFINDLPANGNISVDLSSPVRVGGDLAVGSLSVPGLASALTGQQVEPSADGWSDTPFARAVPENLEVDIRLRSEELDLGAGPLARNGTFRFGLKGSSINIDQLKADWAGGRIEGELGLTAGELGLAMSLRGSLDSVALQDVIWHKDGRSVAMGTLGGSFSLNGRGRSMSGIVSTLNGSGSFNVRDGVIRSINPTAFSSIVRAADTGLVLNPDRVRSVFEGYLDAGSLPFERASGSFSVTSGTVRVSTLSLDAESATVLGGGMLDLNTRTLSSDWSLKVDPGSEKVTGAEPEIGILFSGPISDPGRQVDVTPLMGYLTVRSFEKEVTRIEALQANIQERERLVRLLKVQREQAEERIRRQAEEEAARKAAEEEAARKAAEEEAARRAAEEAARKAAEEEAARLAAEEAARKAAAEEAARLAAEEAARKAAEEEAARLAAEEAARKAAEEE